MEQQRDITNRILRSLDRETFERLRCSFRAAQLPHRRVISRVFEEVDDVYFLNSGLVSLVQRMEDGRLVEVGVIGLDGITSSFTLCGLGASSVESLVQIPVSAIRVPREAVIEEMARDDQLRHIVQNYGQYLIQQIAQTAACNRLHSVTQRTCRWLLTSADSARANSFYLTHEFLAEMLGVQRSGVSVSAHELKNAGIIQYSRGRVSIRDRQALENGACECYFDIRQRLEMVFERAGGS